MTDHPRRRKWYAGKSAASSLATNDTPKRAVAAPALALPKKTADRMVSRFQSLLPDIEGLTERIIETDLDHTQAIEVQSKADDLVDWAPNVITWCADSRFLGMRPFAKQAEVLLNLFEDYCPRCTDKDYFKDIPVLDSIERVLASVALLDNGRCPHCRFTKKQGREKGLYKDPTEFLGVFGQRSGKTALVSMGMSYLMHQNLRLPSPWKTYGLMPGQIIDFTVVATTRDQAEKTLWGTFKGIIENSAWFRAYKEVVNEEGKRHGVRDTVKAGETFLWFGHKSLIMYFAANNPSGLRGTTRFGGAIDELAWFDAEAGSQKVRANGPETYAALSNACLTLRTRVDEEHHKDKDCLWPMPVMFCTSSPRAMNDAIMTLFREKAAQKRVVRRHWATWEAHPKNSKAALESIGELSSPTASRDYGAQPPITDDPLMPRLHMIVDAFKTPLSTDKKYGPVIVPTAVGYVEDLDVKSGKKLLTYLTAGLEDDLPVPNYAKLQGLKESALDALGPLRETFEDIISRPPAKRNHVMGVDIGVTNNAMALVCGYLSTDGSKFITDFVLEIKPTRNRSVNVSDVYEELITVLVERLSVVAVYYDQWNSLHQIQDLSNRYGSLGPLNSKVDRRAWLRDHVYEETTPSFIADQYRLVMADALMLVSRLEQGDCLFPTIEVGVMELLVNKRLDPLEHPYAHLALQMATVRARGNRLLKPISGDDDLFRAWANAAVKAFTDEMLIEMLKLEGRAKPAKAAHTVSGYVSLGMGGGKGIRRTETLGRGALSTSGVPGMPVVTRKGAFRG